MAGESAGQCGPCVFGLPAVARDLALVAFGRPRSADVERLWLRLGAVEGRGACRHPDGVAAMVRSARSSPSRADLDRHLAGGPCAGALREASRRFRSARTRRSVERRATGRRPGGLRRLRPLRRLPPRADQPRRVGLPGRRRRPRAAAPRRVGPTRRVRAARGGRCRFARCAVSRRSRCRKRCPSPRPHRCMWGSCTGSSPPVRSAAGPLSSTGRRWRS